MANIALTSECNRRCGYCFARGVMEGPAGRPARMTFEVFEAALDFLARSGVDEVRLLGGEPTLHPEFSRYVELVMRRDLRLLVFTGGSVPDTPMACLEALSPERASVLVNIIPPGGGGAAAPRQRQKALLGRLGRRCMLGLTVDAPGIDPMFLLDLIERFGLRPAVRLGLAHPVLGGANDYLHPRHYPEVGRRLASFGLAALERDVRLDFDCGFVPCMFPEGALRALGKRADEIGLRCNPILDVLPDGRVIDCCALAAHSGAVALPANRDASWLRRRFSVRRQADRAFTLKKECAQCRWRNRGECSGGCLAASLRRGRRADGSGEIGEPRSRRARRASVPSDPTPPRQASAAAPSATRLDQRLPIFHLERNGKRVIYTPGRTYQVISLLDARRLEDALGLRRPERHHRLRDPVRSHGLAVDRSWREFTKRRFEPTRLTVCLSNRCNLACTYCFSAPKHTGSPSRPTAQRFSPLVSVGAVKAAARLVARNCARRDAALVFALHGGGEPTLHWDLLQGVEASIRRTAVEHGVSSRGYVATNGVLSEEKARWLARNMEAIGLSCDGPPEIQDEQRPGLRGGTSKAVERTAKIFASGQADVSARVTVTPATVERQAEIVEYLGESLGIRTIRLEPVYQGRGRGNGTFVPSQAQEFAQHFRAAQRVARRIGCRLQLSGVRPDELHGPYCNVLRGVLQLTPDGAATACFLSTSGRDRDGAPLVIGRRDPKSGEFLLDHERITALQRMAVRVPDRCRSCVNIYHCARDCPNACLALDGEEASAREGFRCRVQRLLGESWILTGECPAYTTLEHPTVEGRSDTFSKSEGFGRRERRNDEARS